jgi:hypothetical protein
LGAAAIGVVVVALMLLPVLPLRDTYARHEARGHTNALVHEMAGVAVVAHAGGEPILLSEKIEAKFSGGGHIHRVMATLLGLGEVPSIKVHKELKRIDEQLDGCGATGCVLILPERQYHELAERYPLEPVPLSPPPSPEDGEPYGVYRYRRTSE